MIDAESRRLLVSYIIPAYNVSEYLGEALESLLVQDYRPLEVIIVDDGSSDSTGSIIAEFKSKHSSDDFCVIHERQDHAGVSEARNTGIRLATGGIIGFFDADDALPPRRTSLLLQALEQKRADVAYGPHLRFRKLSEIRHADEAFAQTTNAECVPINPVAKFVPGVWSFLARREVVEKIGDFLAEISIGEDVEYVVRMRCLYPRLVQIPEIVYYYRQTVGSASSTGGPAKALNRLRSTQAMVVALRNAGIDEAASWDRVSRRFWQAAKDSIVVGLKNEAVTSCVMVAKCSRGGRKLLFQTLAGLLMLPGVVPFLAFMLRTRSLKLPSSVRATSHK